MIKADRDPFLEYIGYGGRTARKQRAEQTRSIGTGIPVSREALFSGFNYGTALAETWMRREQSEYPTSPRT